MAFFFLNIPDSPWAPFDHWHLKSEYKNIHKRKDLAKR